MGRNFIPNSDQRKEEKYKRRIDRERKIDLERASMELMNRKKVHIKALDLSVGGAFNSWLGFRPQKAVMVDKVMISTDIPLPRKDWIEIVALLEKKVSKQEAKK